MSKRTLYQCDRCSKNVEQEFMPTDWVEITATQYTDQPHSLSNQSYRKMWCRPCWHDVSAPLPLEGK